MLQFDAIAQFDEGSNKVDWYLCGGCLTPAKTSAEMEKDGTIASWVFDHQENVVLGTLDRETRFPTSMPSGSCASGEHPVDLRGSRCPRYATASAVAWSLQECQTQRLLSG